MSLNPERSAKHAAARARQWYGLDVTKEDMMRLGRDLAERRVPSQYVSRGKRGERVLLVDFMSKQIKVVLNERHAVILTVLRMGAQATTRK